ncbi:MAG: hypothetical protein AAB845_00240, partial [Patescibacteria group bacterium]
MFEFLSLERGIVMLTGVQERLRDPLMETKDFPGQVGDDFKRALVLVGRARSPIHLRVCKTHEEHHVSLERAIEDIRSNLEPLSEPLVSSEDVFDHAKLIIEKGDLSKTHLWLMCYQNKEILAQLKVH